jgi:hypothetical protein
VNKFRTLFMVTLKVLGSCQLGYILVQKFVLYNVFIITAGLKEDSCIDTLTEDTECIKNCQSGYMKYLRGYLITFSCNLTKLFPL